MKNMEKNISKLVNRFIKESFVDITDMDTDKAVEEVTEKAHGKNKKFGDGRDNIDVAEPKGKITGADFKKLKSMKKKEMGENYGMEDEMGGGYYKYDNPNRHKASKLADRFPGVTFSDDDLNKGEDELIADYERIMGKKRTPAGFEFGELVAEEGETEEGNEFTGALAKAREEGKDTFTVDGKEYNVTKESVNRKIERILERRRSRVNERKEKTNKNKVVFTESELIDFIERIVEAETKEDKSTMKSLKTSKSVNDKAISDTVKKMKEYMENMGMEYNENTKDFPKGNKIMSREGKGGKEVKDDVKKAYKASGQIEEYIENLTASALENIDYDNIKPNEDWVTDNIEGSSRTGNSQEYANAVPTDVNKKRNKIRKDNLLATLKRQAYNKAPQPVHSDEAGEIVPSALSGKKNQEVNRIMHTESIEEKKVINDMEKMKKLINYNQKTQ